ncbi:Xaa-Pro dipeptidase [Halomonas shantousis]
MMDDAMTDDRLKSLHHAHLDRLERDYARVLDEQGYDGVWLYSGHPHYHFADDQQASFVSYGHFVHWLSAADIEHSWLLIRPGHPPCLWFYAPEDFWHLSPALPGGVTAERFTIEALREPRFTERLPGRLAVLGDVTPIQAQALGAEANPAALVAALDELRVCKSDYEIACIEEANRLALRGHMAARDSFFAGDAELDIQLAYLMASRQRESHVPYQNIVGVNTHAGVLHYQHYDRTPAARRHSLLVDAGCRVAGYAADITRTWAGDEAHDTFRALVEGVETLQQALIEEMHPGVSYVELHLSTHRHLAALLKREGLINCSVDAALARGITRAFCPHGLGHLLGIQVHDVAGRQKSASGETLPAPAEHPALRLTRPLKTGMVVTVEPGLYFIDMLLEPLRQGQTGRDIDWARVDGLRAHGGIRIEDNIAITAEGSRNLTRR